MNIRTLNNAFTQNTDNEVKGKLVRSAFLTRRILRLGGNDVRIIDVKKDREDKTGLKSVFVFEDTDKFQEVFSKVLADVKHEKESSGTEGLMKEIETLRNELAELKKNQTKE